AAAAGPDQEAQLAKAGREVHPAQRLDARLTLAEVLLHATAGDGQIIRQHGAHPLKTSAGSRTSTRRMLRTLATTVTNRMQAPVRATHCHISTMPRVARLCSVISKKVAAIHVPIAKPSAATLAACSRIIPTRREFPTPIAL